MDRKGLKEVEEAKNHWSKNDHFTSLQRGPVCFYFGTQRDVLAKGTACSHCVIQHYLRLSLYKVTTPPSIEPTSLVNVPQKRRDNRL